MFGFEIIDEISIDNNSNCYEDHSFIIFREVTTDVLWISYFQTSPAMMYNPKTGLPLTYEVWKKEYNK